MGTTGMIFKPGHYYKRVYHTEPPCWVIFRVIAPSATPCSMSVIVIKDKGFKYDSRGDILLLVDTSDWSTEEIEEEDLLWEVL